MPEVFQPQLLRECLPPLLQAGGQLPQELAYRRFYGLDSPLAAQIRLGSLPLAGYRLAVQYWLPALPRASLLLLHGYYDHMGLYRHLIHWALQQGFAVLACDLPGHGLSSGAPARIGDFAEYRATLEALLDCAQALQLPCPWHLLGQSTGAGIVLDYLLTGAPRAELGESILLAPLVRPMAWWRVRLAYQLLRHVRESIPRSFSANSADHEFLHFVRHVDPLQAHSLPLAWVAALQRWVPRIESAPRSSRCPLIIQGDADRTVDWRYNLGVLQDKFCRPDILLLPGARHHLANESAGLRQRYLDYLGQRLAGRGQGPLTVA
jgi:alpha-beta hydrolase superfamily lysophospholipase